MNPYGRLGAVTLLGLIQTQVYRRETARDSRIAEGQGEVNDDLVGFALKTSDRAGVGRCGCRVVRPQVSWDGGAT